MITNSNRNHPAVIVVTASHESDDCHIPTTDHHPPNASVSNGVEIPENSSLHKATSTPPTTSATKDLWGEHDNVNDITESKDEDSILRRQSEQDEDAQHEQQHQLLHEASEQSRASSVTSAISILTPQGAVMRQQQNLQQQQHEQHEPDDDNDEGEEQKITRQQLLQQQQQQKEPLMAESPYSVVIDQKQLRIIQSVTRSIIRTIRESASITTTGTVKPPPLPQQQYQPPPPQHQHQYPAATKCSQHHDIITQTIPLFPSSTSSSMSLPPFPVSAATGSYTAAQQLYIDLQRHSYSFVMIGSAEMSNRSSSSSSRNDIVDQWTTTVCQGITTPDINAVVTDALLSALYMVIESDDNDTFHQLYSEQIIKAVISCAFEESNASSSMDNITIHSNNSQRNVLVDQNEKKGGTSTVAPASIATTAPTGTLSSRRRASTMSIPTTTGTNDKEQPSQLPVRNLPPRQSSFYESKSALINHTSTTSTEDELAVYQLLRLVSLLVEKWKPQHGLAQQLIGLLDMCWHVHSKTQHTTATSRILQQTAMDTELRIIQSILLFHCSETSSVIMCHVLNRISKQLLLSAQPGTTKETATNSAKSSLSSASPSSINNQDIMCIDPSSGMLHSQLRGGSSSSGIHNCLTVTTHYLVIIKLAIQWLHMEERSSEVCARPVVSILLGQVIRNVITVAMDTNHAKALNSCIEIVDAFISTFGLAPLKCEFEVFMHTVLLRRLMSVETTESRSFLITEKEIVLEYLEQICFATQTGSSSASINLLDIYINYDCDCACTNLFETIMLTLSNVARPTNWTTLDMNMTISSSTYSCDPNSLNVSHQKVSATGEVAAAPVKSTPSDMTTNANHMNRMALNCILSAIELAEQIAIQNNFIIATGPSCTWATACDESMIHTKKSKKLSLGKVVHSFNSSNPDKGEWLDVAVEEGVLRSTNDCVAIAKLLFLVPLNIDKQRVGIYLSRGPESDFPFQASIRTHFVSMFDFHRMSFSLSLRKFLSKFRLPGEAQCIDRLMEVFSKEYFHQQKESTIFHNADAVYVLAFSTIMLNTDLHNPTIKADHRMTLEQFLRNNRGINAGEDLTDDYLTDLYGQIRERELQRLTEMDQFASSSASCSTDSKVFWDAIYDHKGAVDAAIRLSEDSCLNGRESLRKDLLATTTASYIPALVGIFVTSTDDMVIARVLRAIKQLLKLMSDSEMDYAISNILQMLFAVGQDYIVKHSSDDAFNVPSPSTDQPRRKRHTSIDSASLSEDILLGIENNQIPFSLLCSNTDAHGSDYIVGCSEHRGMLALDCCFVFIKNNPSRVNEAWPAFVKSLCMLRDIRALPKSLADLDDFADSSGHVLPLSSFALGSQKRLQDHHRAMNDKENPKQKGWFRSLFRKSKIDDQVSDAEFIATSEADLSETAKALLEIVQSSEIESIVQMGSSKVPDTSIGALLEILDLYPFEHDPVDEQHAIFTVELAARALLSHHERAENLFLIFLSKFEHILCKATNVDGDIPDAPFIIERIVVTILRCCIHLYEYPKLRPHLRASLQLLTMTLPRSFIHVISNRMSCGLAIILRASYPYFEDQQEWSFMNDILDALAHYETSRVFVFDGIASTVEYAMPNFNINSNAPSSSYFIVSDTSAASYTVSDEDDLRRLPPCLSIEACNVLSRILMRFVLNYYHGDESLMVPAMLCLEKVYRRKVEILLTQHKPLFLSDESIPSTPSTLTSLTHTNIDIVSNAPDPELWQNVAVAIYSLCRSPDPDASTIATKCFRRIVVRTGIDQIEHSVWVTMLYLMVHKQPTTMSEVSRANTFSVLGQLMLRIVPSLSHRAEYREDIEELILQYAALAEENIQSSLSNYHHRDHNEHSQHRRSVVTTSIMFEKTVQTLTYICNHILSDGWNGDREFSVWMNEALLNPLEIASNVPNSRVHSKVVVTTFMDENELDDVSEISDSLAGEEY